MPRVSNTSTKIHTGNSHSLAQLLDCQAVSQAKVEYQHHGMDFTARIYVHYRYACTRLTWTTKDKAGIPFIRERDVNVKRERET